MHCAPMSPPSTGNGRTIPLSTCRAMAPLPPSVTTKPPLGWSAMYRFLNVPTKTSKRPTTFAGGLIVSTSGTPPPASSSRSSCRRSAGVNSTTPSIARSDTNSTKGAGFVTPRSSMTTRSFTLARAAMPGARPNSIHSGSPTPSTPAIWSPVTSPLSRGYSMG